MMHRLRPARGWLIVLARGGRRRTTATGTPRRAGSAFLCASPTRRSAGPGEDRRARRRRPPDRLHARRSAEAIDRWRAARPAAPLALVLTGTDPLSRTSTSMTRAPGIRWMCASRVVVLQEEALRRLDAATRARGGRHRAVGAGAA
jgi:hypothetical protein